MSRFTDALWCEVLKAWRSRVPWLAAAALSMAPPVGGLFMYILQDPERARSMGLITAKAQLTVGVADWPSYLAFLAQTASVGGAFVFSLMTAWTFGREFSDRTVKDLLAVPTPRAATVWAKFAVVGVWTFGLVLWIGALGLVVGRMLSLPGWSTPMVVQGAAILVGSAGLTLALMPPVAFFASAGRGYLPPLGWAIFTVALAQIVAVTGWGAWFPWSVPALFSGLAGPRATLLGAHSYGAVAVVFVAGLTATLYWWNQADQTT